MAREGIILRCTECKDENYVTKVDKKKQEGKLEVYKYCPKCNKKTLHRQKK